MAQALHPCKVGSGIKEELTTPNPQSFPRDGEGRAAHEEIAWD